MDEDAPALSHTVIEAQRRHALKLRLRKECLAFNIDVEHLFDTPERSQTAKDLVPPEVFYKTLALHGIRFNDDDKTLLLHFASPSGLLSLQSFLHFLDLQRPSDHVDPDLTFALLPQPFRMLTKILDDDILDRAWSAITSSMTYKLQQGQLNADLQEKEAKALLCPPSSAVVIAVTIPSLDWPIRVCGDRDLIGVLHDNSTLELLQANGEQTMPPTTPLFSSPRLQVQCLSEFKPMSLGQVKRTFFAIGARKLPKPSPPPPVEGAPVQAVVDVPDPVVDSLESLVHVYATNSTATSLRYTFSTMDRVVGLTLADDVLFLAVHFESGAVDVYRTPNLASDLASESVAALDASSLVLHVDPSSYRIQAPNKGVASDAAATAAAVTATPAATKGDKHKDKGKGNKDLVVEDVALAIAPPAVYSAYLFVAFLMDLSPQPSTTPTTTGIVLASQYKMLQFQLSPAPPSMCASTTVILSSNVMCAALDASATLVVLGLESGSVIAWNTRLHVELSGLGCHSTSVMALSLFKADCLISLSKGNEVHFYSLATSPTTSFESIREVKSLVRVRTGELGTSPYVSVATAADVPLTILGQADGTVTVLDARNGDILGSLSLDGRLPIVDAPMSALSFVVGDAVYVPTSATEGNQSLRSIHLNMYSSTSILQTCFAKSALSAPSVFLDRYTPAAIALSPPTLPSATTSTGPSKPLPSPPPTSGPPPSSTHVARIRRPSVIGGSSSLLLRGASTSTCTGATISPVSCSLNLPTPPATKGLHAIYMRMLQKHEAVAIERDARMAKRRADVLKSLNSIW